MNIRVVLLYPVRLRHTSKVKIRTWTGNSVGGKYLPDCSGHLLCAAQQFVPLEIPENLTETVSATDEAVAGMGSKLTPGGHIAQGDQYRVNRIRSRAST